MRSPALSTSLEFHLLLRKGGLCQGWELEFGFWHSRSQERWRRVFCSAFAPRIELGLRRDRHWHCERRCCGAHVWEGDADHSWGARHMPSLCSCPAFLPLLSLHLSAWPSRTAVSILLALSLLYSSASALHPALYCSSSRPDTSQLIFFPSLGVQTRVGKDCVESLILQLNS